MTVQEGKRKYLEVVKLAIMRAGKFRRECDMQEM
jgi:hypothetical protein